mmetsp:Transcript_4501/g.7221  ORF Transcript_4501/g.7221 Transcript_4501/m.7221 type:complete len:124 (-) Transcript_4501:751-1122(-)
MLYANGETECQQQATRRQTFGCGSKVAISSYFSIASSRMLFGSLSNKLSEQFVASIFGKTITGYSDFPDFDFPFRFFIPLFTICSIQKELRPALRSENAQNAIFCQLGMSSSLIKWFQTNGKA